jgi:hypothetical protein
MAASVAALSSTSSSARLGEVIETSTTSFTAESDELHVLPELGALVRVRGLSEDTSFFGVVAFGLTGGLDTSRRAVRRGAEGVADDAIYKRHPELELVLRTLFDVAVVGYERASRIYHNLPVLPVPLHYNVHACNRSDVSRFSSEPRYLPTLLNFRGDIMPEQLLASHLRWVDHVLNDGHAWLQDATRRLARLMKRDYDQLVTILQAVDPS